MKASTVWLPLLSPKQLSVFNLFARYALICGPRRSGKTRACLHRLLRHAFDTHKAKILIVVKTIGSAKDAGIWSELVEIVLPEWQAAGFLPYVPDRYGKTGPKQDAQSRSMQIILENRYGEPVQILLNSLEWIGDAERKFKGKNVSCVYISEITNWSSRKLFEVLKETLRGEPYKSRSMICDCNPDPDNAMWVYDLWYSEPKMEGFPENCVTDEEKKEFLSFQAEKAVIEIGMDENPFLSAEEKASLIASYRHDPDLYARYVKGEWRSARVDGFFSNHFNYDIHVLGNCSKPDEKDWELIIPRETVNEIIAGWDIGSVWPAVVFMCKERDKNGMNHWSILDEVVISGEETRMDDFLVMVMDKMTLWKKLLGRPVVFRHYSDQSSFHWNIAAQASEQITIQKLSLGTIRLFETQAKYAGAALDAVDLIRRLLFEQRLWVSANCFKVIEMFKSLAPVATRMPGQSLRVSKTKHTHPFDALRYALCTEEPLSLAAMKVPRTNRVRPRIVALA